MPFLSGVKLFGQLCAIHLNLELEQVNLNAVAFLSLITALSTLHSLDFTVFTKL